VRNSPSRVELGAHVDGCEDYGGINTYPGMYLCNIHKIRNQEHSITHTYHEFPGFDLHTYTLEKKKVHGACVHAQVQPKWCAQHPDSDTVGKLARSDMMVAAPHSTVHSMY